MALFKKTAKKTSKKVSKTIGDILEEKEAKAAFIGPPKPEPAPKPEQPRTARKPSARDRMAGRTYRT